MQLSLLSIFLRSTSLPAILIVSPVASTPTRGWLTGQLVRLRPKGFVELNGMSVKRQANIPALRRVSHDAPQWDFQCHIASRWLHMRWAVN
ncbi:hypothetical protein N7451_012112 [Penicillium sp. IBT 35674x]|nr:hypothetical protein N7451_012112 [Penicillium sp. IBT 35674x]